MKMLFITNVVSRKICNFSKPSIIVAKNFGIEFHFAANWSFVDKQTIEEEEEKYGIKIHQIDFERNPYNRNNYRAYKQLKELMTKYKFDAIHCNTPVGSVLGRICAKQSNVSKVIYTAHGFHFYKGAPFINNTLYKCVEKVLAHYTDAIITMNQEDFNAAKKFKLKDRGKVYYIPGVGIDTHLYKNNELNKDDLRESLGIKCDDIVLISMGDLIPRKNYEDSIKVIAKINDPKIKLLICGEGPKLQSLKKLTADLKVDNQIYFLGFRTDIKELLMISDLFLFTTYQEGLSRSMMEAMAAGLPCIVSKIRGNIDLIEHEKGGYLIDSKDIDGFSKAIEHLYKDLDKRKAMQQYNLDRIKNYDVENIVCEMEKIYEKELFKGRKG